MGEQSLLTPEIRGSNPNIGKFLSTNCTFKMKRRKKEKKGQEWPVFKKTAHRLAGSEPRSLRLRDLCSAIKLQPLPKIIFCNQSSSFYFDVFPKGEKSFLMSFEAGSSQIIGLSPFSPTNADAAAENE